jgi:adenosylcobinamide-GDP ribazoletransferase
MQRPKLRDIVTDVRIGLSLVTILPLGPSTQISDGDIARAGWTFPVAGLLVGLLGAAIYAIANRFGLPSTAAALLALAGTIIITGALHEDGLADSADSLGGRTRDRKLEIMRDSRIGSFGVCALVISLGLRWTALAAIAAPRSVLIALLLAHAAARAGLPLFMALVPPARTDGLAAGAGRPAGPTTAIALGLGAVMLAIGFGAGKAILAVALLAIIGLAVAWLAIRQIGGLTGDVLGAYEQLAEIAILLMAAALFHPAT